MSPLKSLDYKLKVLKSLAFESQMLLPTRNVSLSSLHAFSSKSLSHSSAVSNSRRLHDLNEKFDVNVLGLGLGELSMAVVLSSQGCCTCALEVPDCIGGEDHSFTGHMNGDMVKFESYQQLLISLNNFLKTHLLTVHRLRIPLFSLFRIPIGAFLSLVSIVQIKVCTSSPFLKYFLSRYGSSSAADKMAALLSAFTTVNELAFGLIPALVSSDFPLCTLRTLLHRCFGCWNVPAVKRILVSNAITNFW